MRPPMPPSAGLLAVDACSDVADKRAIDDSVLNDGEDENSGDQGDEGFDEQEEDAAEGASGSPAKQGCGRTPRRNGIEFLQVTACCGTRARRDCALEPAALTTQQ
jgi:hypothetical protein